MVNHSLSHSRGSSAIFWKKHLQQYRASGLSVAAFCRLHSLGVASFYAWRRRLLDGATFVPASASASASAEVGVEGKGISWREVSLSIPGPGAVASATGWGGPPGLSSAACALKLGSAHGLWAEFPRFPSPEELTAVCRAIHAPQPPLC